MAGYNKKLVRAVKSGVQLHSIEHLDNRLRLQKVDFHITHPGAKHREYVEITAEELMALATHAVRTEHQLRENDKRRAKTNGHAIEATEDLKQ
jgi:hypothetical protein